MALVKPREILKRGTRAAQPAASAVAEGTLYCVTDEYLIERSTGAAWESFGANYVTGTWTPDVQFGGAKVGITYSAANGQVGYYTRVGNLVFVEHQVILTSKGSSTGNMTIAGLPFTVKAIPANSNVSFSYWANWNAAITSSPGGYIGGGGTSILVFKAGAGSVSQVQDTDLNNNSSWVSAGFYLA